MTNLIELIERLEVDADGWTGCPYESGQRTERLEREAAAALRECAELLGAKDE